MTFTAIIPALNEGKTIRSIVQTLQEVEELSEIIVIDDGSVDDTALQATMPGVRVIRNEKNLGKGAAMRIGASASTSDVIVFFDADLIGVTPRHVILLVSPFQEESFFGMVVGLRDRYNGMTHILKNVSPLFMLSGERAIQRSLFLTISRFSTDFGIEVVMNAYCIKHHIPLRYVNLKGLHQVIKEIKYGFFKGFFARLRMVGQVIRAFVMIK